MTSRGEASKNDDDSLWYEADRAPEARARWYYNFITSATTADLGDTDLLP